MGWIGVDLDGTLAEYDGVWVGPESIGSPIPAMVERVRHWLAEGTEVRIFTARVWSAPELPRSDDSIEAERHIRAWCLTHLGIELPVTCMKDYGMVALWDDRCVEVKTNTGETVLEWHASKPAINRAEIVRTVKDIRLEPDLSLAVDLAVAQLVKRA